MNAISLILLIINILSVIWVALLIPYALIQFFLGDRRASRFLEIVHCPISEDALKISGIIAFLVASIFYVLREVYGIL